MAATVLTGLTAHAIAGPKEEALSVVQAWSKAFNESDVDSIVRLYAPRRAFHGHRQQGRRARSGGHSKLLRGCSALKQTPRGYPTRVLYHGAVGRLRPRRGPRHRDRREGWPANNRERTRALRRGEARIGVAH